MPETLYVEYDGDPCAAAWPIVHGVHVVGSVLNDERGYRARREAQGMMHVAPARPFMDQALGDFRRWLEDPLSNLDCWISSGGE